MQRMHSTSELQYRQFLERLGEKTITINWNFNHLRLIIVITTIKLNIVTCYYCSKEAQTAKKKNNLMSVPTKGLREERLSKRE